MGSSIKCLTATMQLFPQGGIWLVQKAICFTPQGNLNKLPIEEAHPYKLGRKFWGIFFGGGVDASYYCLQNKGIFLVFNRNN